MKQITEITLEEFLNEIVEIEHPYIKKLTKRVEKKYKRGAKEIFIFISRTLSKIDEMRVNARRAVIDIYAQTIKPGTAQKYTFPNELGIEYYIILEGDEMIRRFIERLKEHIEKNKPRKQESQKPQNSPKKEQPAPNNTPPEEIYITIKL